MCHEDRQARHWSEELDSCRGPLAHGMKRAEKNDAAKKYCREKMGHKVLCQTVPARTASKLEV